MMKKSISFILICSLLMSMPQQLMAQEIVPENIFTYIQRGDGAGIRRLIDEGVDVNQPGAFGEIALITAAERGNHVVMRELLTAPGIDVNQPGWMGMTALMLAASGKDIAMLKELLLVGADWRLQNMAGKTAFDFAIDSNFKEGIKKLLIAGADYNAYSNVPIVREAIMEQLRKLEHATFQDFQMREIGGGRRRR